MKHDQVYISFVFGNNHHVRRFWRRNQSHMCSSWSDYICKFRFLKSKDGTLMMGSNNPLKGSSWSNQRVDQIEQRKTKVLIFMSFPQKRQKKKKIKTLSYSNNRKKNKWRRLTRDAIKRLISTKPFMILLTTWGF